jgi:hypothetical protein
MSDKNFISFTGDAAGNVFMATWYQGEIATTQVAWAGQTEPREIHLGDIIPPDASFADALKFSGVRDFKVFAKRIVGGREDCIDVNNRCRNIEIIAEALEPRGKYVATVKGESRDVVIRGKVVGKASYVDFALGDHSDQADGRTEGVTLDCTSADGRRLTWQRINATSPNTRKGQRWKRAYTVPGFFRKWFPKIYAFLKNLGFAI